MKPNFKSDLPDDLELSNEQIESFQELYDKERELHQEDRFFLLLQLWYCSMSYFFPDK